MNQCMFCAETIVEESPGVWVDDTGGDCCTGDKITGENENGTHTP
jgi:hypothetical protein